MAFTATQGAGDNIDLISANQSNAFWHANLSKSSLSGEGDTTTYDISTLNNGLTLTQAIEAQIAANPIQAFTDPMYVGFEGQWSDRTSPDGYLVPISITTLTPISAGSPGPLKQAGPSPCLDPEEPDCQDPNFNPPDVTIGGQLTIRIDQKIRLERQAFNATLGIDATAVLSSTTASVKILDANGNDAKSKFFVLVTSDPLGATHGGTVSGQTSVGWQLIPNAGAGGTSPQGTQYQVEATLNYTVSGTQLSTTTQAVTITVLPSPKLQVAYTAPFVVLDAKDAKIRVTVTNTGYGPANNLTIQSMQPTVVNNNPANLSVPQLLINFTLTGSSNTADSSGYIPGNLTINFGNVAPGATVSGYWTLHVSQRGFLSSISSTFTQDDYQGVQLDPLVLPPTTTLVPTIGGTVTSNTGQAVPGLTVSLSQNGTVVATDQTGPTGEYYMQDLAAGSYIEQITDASGKVWVSQNVTLSGTQPTNFVDVVIQNFAMQKAAATLTLNAASLTQTYTGLPASVTATTVPAGLDVIFTYSGSPVPPVAAGTYNVLGTIVDPTYVGAATGTLIINKATPIITWLQPAAIAYGTALSATQLDASLAISTPSTSSSASATMLATPSRASPMTIAQAEITGRTASTSASRARANTAANSPAGDPPLPAPLAFTSDRTRRTQIYTAQNSPLASPTQLTTAGVGQQESEEPNWSRVQVSYFGASSTKIAYQFGAPGVRGIHVMNPDGSADIQLTPSPSQSQVYPCADDRDPTWSPDGQYVAYACQSFSTATEVPTGTYQLWEHDNGRPPNSPASDALLGCPSSGTQQFAPAWSPGGTSVAFVQAGPGAKAEIATIPRTGFGAPTCPPITVLTTGGYTNWDPTWSPDGTQIAFSSTRAVATDVLTSDGTNPSSGDNIYINGQLYTLVAALNGLPYQVLIGTNAQSTLANLKAAINGEGGAGVTYGAGTSPNTDLFASFVKSNTLVVQALQPRADTEIATQSSSAHLTWASAFLTVAAGGHHIFVMNVQCPEAQTGCRPALQLTAGAGDDTYPAWSPDGSTIAFVSNRVTSQNPQGKSQLYLISSTQPETAANPATLISDGTADDGEPAWNAQCSAAQSGLALQIAPLTVSAGLGQAMGTITVTDTCGNSISGATVTIVPPPGGTGVFAYTVNFSPVTGQTVNGQFTFYAQERNPIQFVYSSALEYTVTASATLNGSPVSASATGTVDILGLGSIASPQPPQGLSNQQRLPVGVTPFTRQQKLGFAYQSMAQNEQALHEEEISLGLAGLSQAVELVFEPLSRYLGPLELGHALWDLQETFHHVYLGAKYLSLAEDPPDPDFTSVALPTVQALPAFTLSGGPLSTNTLSLMNQRLAVEAVIEAYLTALQTSVNRYSTALSAGDLTSAALQRDAILNYEDTLVSLFNSDAQVTQNLSTSFQQDGLPNIQLMAQDITNLQNSVAVNGLPGQMVQMLQQLGASATDIATIQSSFINTTAASLTTGFYSLLQSEAQASLNASAAFVVGARPPASTASTLAGSFVYTPPAGTVLNAGIQTLSVVFTPIDFADYTIATAKVPLQVSGLPVVITFDPASLIQIYDGSPKSVTVTTNPANLPVTITYTQNGTPIAAPTNVGSYAVTATVASGNYAGTATATLTIKPSGTPQISVTPDSGHQGQQNLSVALTGQFTNWVQGTTTASFGAGITAASLTVTSPTSATAVLSIGASAATGARTVTMTTGTEIDTLANGFVVTSSTCTPPPSGLVSWWTGDGNTTDSLGGNNPSATNAVSFVPAEVGEGFTFASGGYIDIPASTSLASQQFTWSAWVEPNGPGPNNDSFGSVIVGQNIDDTHTSAQLLWRATDNHFLFLFGDISSQQIVSTDAFAPGQFYLVTATYDGSTFSLFVNGNPEGQFAEAKAISYASSTWTIGSTSSSIRSQGFPRTWNGLIDEVQAFNRALSQTEIQAIYTAATAGECRGQPSLFSIIPNRGQQGQQNLPVALTGHFTNWLQGTTTATFGAGITVTSFTVNAATNATAVLNVDPTAPTGPSAVTLTSGSEVDTLADGFTVAAPTTALPGLVAEYRFDNPSNLGQDSSGNGNNATTVLGVTQGTGPNGLPAAEFDGSSSSFQILGGLKGLTGIPGYTYVAWVYLDPGNFGYYNGIVSQDMGSCCINRFMVINGEPFLNVGAHNDVYLPQSVPSGEWALLAMTADNSGPGGNAVAHVYVNAVEVSGSPVKFGNSLANLSTLATYLGAGEGGGPYRLVGALADVRIFQGALQPSQVQALYNGSASVSGSVTNPAGSAGTGVSVVLTSNASAGGTFRTTTDANGSYTFTGVPVGAFTALASNPAQPLEGESSGNTTFDGQQLTADIELAEQDCSKGALRIGTSSSVHSRRPCASSKGSSQPKTLGARHWPHLEKVRCLKHTGGL